MSTCINADAIHKYIPSQSTTRPKVSPHLIQYDPNLNYAYTSAQDVMIVEALGAGGEIEVLAAKLGIPWPAVGKRYGSLRYENPHLNLPTVVLSDKQKEVLSSFRNSKTAVPDASDVEGGDGATKRARAAMHIRKIKQQKKRRPLRESASSKLGRRSPASGWHKRLEYGIGQKQHLFQGETRLTPWARSDALLRNPTVCMLKKEPILPSSYNDLQAPSHRQPNGFSHYIDQARQQSSGLVELMQLPKGLEEGSIDPLDAMWSDIPKPLTDFDFTAELLTPASTPPLPENDISSLTFDVASGKELILFKETEGQLTDLVYWDGEQPIQAPDQMVPDRPDTVYESIQTGCHPFAYEMEHVIEQLLGKT